MRATFNLSGKIPINSDWFIIRHSIGINESLIDFISLSEMSSSPELDFDLNLLNTLYKASLSIGIKEKVA